MQEISFTIYGTHAGREYNPLPKLKMTGKQHWMPKAQNYVQWKTYVRRAYTDKYGIPASDDKPIELGKDQKARMDIMIYWGKSNTHGDPENIFGSIADALFKNDKNLAGSFDFQKSQDGLARVEVRITIY